MKVHGIVCSYLGDGELDIGKTAAWLTNFTDTLFFYDMNYGTAARKFGIDYAKTFPEAQFAIHPIGRPAYWVDPAVFRADAYAAAKKAWGYADEDWVIFVDASESLAVDRAYDELSINEHPLERPEWDGVPKWRTDYWYGQPTTQTTTLIQGEGVLVVAGLEIPSGLALTEIGMEITTVGTAGALIRMGVYELVSAATLTSTLLQDAGTIPGTVLGVASRPLSIPARSDPWYALLAVVVQGAAGTRPTVRTASGIPEEAPFGRAALNTTTMAAGSFSGYTATSVTGALPATTTVVSEGGSAPRILVRGTQS